MENVPFDPYGPIHKIQRHIFGQLLTALGALDVADDGRIAEAVARVRALIAMIEEHSAHEDEFIHPLLGEKSAVRKALDEQHGEIETTFRRIGADIAALERASLDRRAGAATDLYRDVALLASAYFAHMDVEERWAAPVLLAAGIDNVRAAQAQIVRRVGWCKLRGMLPLALPVFNPEDRAGYLGMLLATFPDEARIDDLLAVAADVLPEPAVARLRAALSKRRLVHASVA